MWTPASPKRTEVLPVAESSCKMFNQLIKERRNYEELEGDCEDRDCGTYRIVRSRWRLRLCSGNDLAASPAGIASGGAVLIELVLSFRKNLLFIWYSEKLFIILS